MYDVVGGFLGKAASQRLCHFSSLDVAEKLFSLSDVHNNVHGHNYKHAL